MCLCARCIIQPQLTASNQLPVQAFDTKCLSVTDHTQTTVTLNAQRHTRQTLCACAKQTPSWIQPSSSHTHTHTHTHTQTHTRFKQMNTFALSVCQTACSYSAETLTPHCSYFIGQNMLKLGLLKESENL